MNKIYNDILLMPKVELHVHIEGAVSSKTYFELAHKNKVSIPFDTLESWNEYFKFKDFGHFIGVYGTAVSTIKKADDYALIVENFYKHQSIQNILYSEAFISASFLVENFRSEEILEAIEYGMKKGEQKYGVKVNIILDIARHIPKTQKAVLKLVKMGFDKGIFIGLGLGGLEINYPAKLFKETFIEAKKNGLRVVAHAGEAVGAESIWEAINELHIERIGHGISCIKDERLMKYLRVNQIPIEISPSSNYHLGVVEQQKKHPIRKMIDYGLLCTLNTDDPVMFSTDLSNEYISLIIQGFSMKEVIQLNRNSIYSSFLGDKEKKAFSHLLDKFLINRKNKT